MENSDLTFYIGILAGIIFFIDAWGPSEKNRPFFESRRFRGLSVIVSGGIIAPLQSLASHTDFNQERWEL